MMLYLRISIDDKSGILGCGCKVDIVLDDGTGCGTDDADTDLRRGELLQCTLDGLDRTLHITLDDDVEPLELTLLDSCVEGLKCDLLELASLVHALKLLTLCTDLTGLLLVLADLERITCRRDI